EQWQSATVSGTAPLGRVAQSRKPVQIADLREDQTYLDGHPLTITAVHVADIHTLAIVPMLKEDEFVGVIAIYRKEVRPFTDKQIELVQNFANHAVIAIENTRLLNELRESLQQQIATADVLKTISSSPPQLEPVFKAMLENAVRVCGAKFGMLYLSEGDGFRAVAMHDVPREFADKRRREPFFSPPARSPLGRVMQTRQVAHVTDITTEQGYIEGDRPLMDLVELGGARTVAAVPMLKDKDLVGAIVIYRQERRPFLEKQIELLTSFASQAVIPIENTRLLNELRQRTSDLSESLEALRELNETLEQRVEAETRERLHVWNVSQDLLVVADLEGKYLSVNPAWTATLGWSEADLLGKTSRRLLHPDDVEKTRAEINRLAAGQKTVRFESRFRDKHGSYHWFSWKAAPDRGRLYGVGRDVTELKDAENKLREAQRELAQAA